MDPVEIPEFQCEACGKRFRWKPELAGRKARCPCGQIMQCPEQAPSAEPSYDLAPETAVAPTPIAPKPTAAPVLPYRSAQTESPDNSEKLKNIYAPLWLLGGGLAVEIIVTILAARNNFPRAMLELGAGVLGGTLVMLIGVLIAAKARDIKLGSLPDAALKLAAISIGVPAATHIASPILMFIPNIAFIPARSCATVLLQFGLYFTLMGFFFDLDESDTWYCSTIIALVGIGVYFAIYFAAR
jgi:hypothetical protein